MISEQQAQQAEANVPRRRVHLTDGLTQEYGREEQGASGTRGPMSPIGPNGEPAAAARCALRGVLEARVDTPRPASDSRGYFSYTLMRRIPFSRLRGLKTPGTLDGDP